METGIASYIARVARWCNVGPVPSVVSTPQLFCRHQQTHPRFLSGRIILESLCCHHQPMPSFPSKPSSLLNLWEKNQPARSHTGGLKWSEKKNNKKHWNNIEDQTVKSFKKNKRNYFWDERVFFLSSLPILSTWRITLWNSTSFIPYVFSSLFAFLNHHQIM